MGRKNANRSKECVTCHGSFLPIRLSSKYCSQDCQHQAMRKCKEKECPCCGVTFTARPGNKRDREQVFCSKDCSFRMSHMWNYESANIKQCMLPPYSMVRPCDACDRLHPHKRRAWCSIECRADLKRRAYYENKPNPEPRSCSECDLLFTPLTSSGAKFCSEICCIRNSRRVHKAKRRARKKGSAYESVNPFTVFERDGWICQLCGTLTPRHYRGTIRPNAPELDHKIPLSRGGDHNYGNVQCLCRACNSAKGNSNDEGRLGLFVAAERRGVSFLQG